MKYSVPILLFLFFLFGCSSNEPSIFFDDCECEKIDFKNGVSIKDTLGRYAINFPDQTWYITKNLDENGNGVTGSNTSLGYQQFASITEIEKGNDWPPKEQGLKEIEENFNVLQRGSIKFKNQKCYWHLVKFDEGILPIYSLYLQYDKNNRLYTINMSVEQGADYKVKLCRLESFLDYFAVH